ESDLRQLRLDEFFDPSLRPGGYVGKARLLLEHATHRGSGRRRGGGRFWEELRERHAECVGEPPNDVNRYALPTGFEVGNGRAAQANEAAQFLRRELRVLPRSLNSGSEVSAQPAERRLAEHVGECRDLHQRVNVANSL